MPAWTRGFRGRLALIAGAALLVRVFHAVAIAPATTGVEDAFWFSQIAHSLSDGDGFTIFTGSNLGDLERVPSAQHPPLYPLLLAAAVELGITGDEGLRTLGAIFGTAAVALVGLLGRRIAGDMVGLVAALLAAAYPLLIANDGALLSETLYAAIIAATLLAALKTIDRPTPQRAAVLGALIGLAILTRSEAVLLLALLAAPVAWLAKERRATTFGIVCLTAAITITPWLIRNHSAFDQPVLSTNGGNTLAWTNCDAAYYGNDIGYLPDACNSSGRPGENEAQSDDRLRDEGIDYASDHAGRVPAVVAVRVLRMWGFWQPFRNAREQGRSANIVKLGIVVYYPLLALAIYGAFVLRHRRAELTVLLAAVALATLTAIATYGSIRLRLPGDVALVVLAAVGAVEAARRLLVQNRAEPHDRCAL